MIGQKGKEGYRLEDYRIDGEIGHTCIGSAGTAASIGTRGQSVKYLEALAAGIVFEAREAPEEGHRHLAHRAVSLLGDDELGEAGVLGGRVVDLVAVDE